MCLTPANNGMLPLMLDFRCIFHAAQAMLWCAN
ncbi:hypothetical protein [Klebsiella phage vB_KpnS-VAC35]|uniref:Uncharacterized protein n=1 Tax=Klebsiella phage vB_KpnS-VAC35 TaxID=2866696 RepID=A0AAE9C5U6_9CAUD|nr:hypothetical protein [Klebsiella phage vB_KpnS-VAC35]